MYIILKWILQKQCKGVHLAQGKVQRRPLVNVVMNVRDISGPGKRLSFSQEQDMLTDTGLHMHMASSDAAVERVSKSDVKVRASQHVSCYINKSSPHATYSKYYGI